MNKLQSIYLILLESLGPQHWWPGDSAFEMMVGAILTQNTNWINVEKAIANLKKAHLLDPSKLLNLRHDRLAKLIRPAGYFNVKTKRLKNFLSYFVERYKGRADLMKKRPLKLLRNELLAVNGIGKETADSILVYALGKPIFVCDAYTKRIFVRHGLVGKDADYDRLQAIFMKSLARNAKVFNEYHALIVNVGKNFCRTTPRCDKCPLHNTSYTSLGP